MIGLMTGIAAGTQVAGGLFKGKQQKEAGEAAQARYNQAADLQWETTQENMRRMQLDFDQQMGTAEAQIGGSGVQMGGTPEASLMAAQTEFQRELDWTQEASATREAMLRDQGAIAAETGEIGAIGSALGGIGGAIGTIGVGGKAAGWWT